MGFMMEEHNLKNFEESNSGPKGVHLVDSANLDVACLETEIGRLTYTVDCMEPKLEDLRLHVFNLEHAMLEILKGDCIEEIVSEVVEIVSLKANKTHNLLSRTVGTTFVEQMDEDLFGEHGRSSQDPLKKLTKSPVLDGYADEGPHEELIHDENKPDLVTRVKQQPQKTLRSRKQQRSKPKAPIFAISGLITPENAHLMKFLFRKNGIGEDKWSEVVASYGDYAVTRKEFQCLSPATPLSCKVINISAAYLNEPESEHWFLPSFFGERARVKDESCSYAKWLTSTIEMCGLKRFHRRLQQCSKIFIPLHDNMEDHWILLVMHLPEKKAEVLDSFPDVRSRERQMDHARDVMAMLQKVFGSETTWSNSKFYHFPSFTLNFSDFNPTHEQRSESGVFVIRHMQYYRGMWSTTFHSEDQRTRLALEIVLHPRNEHRQILIGAAAGASMPPIGESELFKNIPLPPTGRKFRSHRKRRDHVSKDV
ncbi:uncharacterized protein LOC121053032 [Rosa chinensis]|uniref:uncharacterized protein LOC121053032 n=1 Tax=Rosa chinensis TaxID=74649 RepID=UPI001AD8D287|nr:uncharacterized protein LOC121053032 [Rosa chinensis]